MKKIFYLSIAFIGLLICSSSIVNAQGGLGVNTTGAPADNSAGLDVSNSSQGVLLPRMTTIQRGEIYNPATGLTIFNTDCNLYNYNAGTPSSPNWIIVNSTNAVVAGVSISSNPAAGAICGGAPVTFTATTTGVSLSNPAPTYQWKVSGANVGSNSSTYTTSSLQIGNVVTCVLTTTENCVTGLPATSNAIVVTNSVPAAPASITPPVAACQDSMSGNIYIASAVPGATRYNWLVPLSGYAFITGGAGTDTLSVGFGDTVGNIGSLTVTASNGCGVSTATTSAPIVLGHAGPAEPGNITGVVNSFIDAVNVPYSISAVTNATTYTWTSPGNTVMAEGSPNTSVTFGSTLGTTYIYVTAGNSCGTSAAQSLAVNLCTYTPGSYTFTYTGSPVTWTAPCATSLTITTVGAAGGGANDNFGYGGSATGTLAILPGATLYINVGGAGTTSSNTGGWNGGGSGGTLNYYSPYSPSSSSDPTSSNCGSYYCNYQYFSCVGGNYAQYSCNIYGYGGGGASDVRVGGTALSNRIIVGGGGGGAGIPYANAGTWNDGENSLPGSGGGTTGGLATEAADYDTYNSSYFGSYGGAGGTQSAGGAAGYNLSSQCQTSSPNGPQVGSIGQGGGSDGAAAGGGGGGYYGGGGGQTSYNYFYQGFAASGGGGGSSYIGGVAGGSTSGSTNGGPGVGTYNGNGYIIISW